MMRLGGLSRLPSLSSQWIGVRMNPLLFPEQCGVRLLRSKPQKPESLGEVIAHFPQKKETQCIKENEAEYAKRLGDYIDELAKVAVPEKLTGGRDFGSKVRSGQKNRENTRDREEDVRERQGRNGTLGKGKKSTGK